MLQSLCPTTIQELHVWIVVSGFIFAVSQVVSNKVKRRLWSHKAVSSGIEGTSAPTFFFLALAPFAPDTMKLISQDATVYMSVAGLAGLFACIEAFLSGWAQSIVES